MEISEVRDHESLEAYLEGLEGDIGLLIARRVAYLSAMRMAPLALQYFLLNRTTASSEVTGLPVFAALAYSAVASAWPTPSYNPESAISATKFEGDIALSDPDTPELTDVPALAARSAAAAADSAALVAVGSVVTAFTETGERFNLWELVRKDLVALAADPECDLPAIWPSIEIPIWTTTIWKPIRDRLKKNKPRHWTFWITWYDRALAGEDLYPHKLAPILDRFTKEDWLGDPALVNPAFDEVLALYKLDEVVRQNPYAWQVLLVESGKLQSEARETPDLTEIVDRMQRALQGFDRRCARYGEDGNLGPIMQTAFDGTLADLVEDVSFAGTDSLAMFDALGLAKLQIERIVKTNAFPADAPHARLLDELELFRGDICVASPTVAETDRRRANIEFDRHQRAFSSMAMSALAGLAADSEDTLEAAALLALQRISDPDATQDEKREAWYFVRAMVPQGARAQVAGGVDSTKRDGVMEYLKTAGEVGKAASNVDKGINAVQENVAEGAPVLLRAYTELSSGNFWGLGA